ncbi:apolipoprotein D-like [Conger conger]|uniref:apolipoprotein D-like n=1 Tax=Conger conger TaxID=82655 RepID=UPI002A598B0E|nr:apolipoprotein D-like [Conger conger]XP_061099952.1 apolipoprotein D-like [Conger conger]
MKASFALILPLLLSLSNAQVPHWGTCPEPPLQPNFVLKQFLGTWYEVAKLPAQYEKGRCIETNLTMNADGTIKVSSSEIRKGQLKTMEGTGIVEDINQPAKLGISFSFLAPYSPYWIISTDYDKSALVYSCTDILRLFHVDFAWILGRTRTLPADTINRAKDIFTKSNIDVTRMISSKQQGCDKEF